MPKDTETETPLSWGYFLEDLKSVEGLLLAGASRELFQDPNNFLRPAPLMICSIWEAFHIRTVGEGAAFLAGFVESSEDLPTELKKQVANEIRKDLHELSPWRLAGTSWKNEIKKRIEKDIVRLQSGKSKHVDEFYSKGLGLKKLSGHWRISNKSQKEVLEVLDSYIKHRDRIAHKGDPHLSKECCWDFLGLVKEQSVRTVIAVDRHITKYTKVRFCDANMRQLRAQYR